jgi:CheY-like chemotaxis protein/serine phosphatase RsbU (regulator of sigma subunit)
MADKSKILVVDDNLKNIQVLGGFLQAEGFEVEFSLDGKSALNWIGKQDFDLILLDIMMPEMDGFEVCTIIKQNPEHKDLPVIFITAKVDHESIIKGFEIGAVDYITKPFIKSELLARVKTHVEIKQSRDRLARFLKEIEAKNRNITASIEYAKNIQNALLRASEGFEEVLPEHFILFQPKDIVSGDFYWFTFIDNYIVIAIMDCTGHGVPGALMSTLGVAFLNETVLGERTLDPCLILESLRKKLINSLGQRGYSGTIKDGIEGSIICFDLMMKQVRFSASFNPLLHIHDGEIAVVIADRVPIGYFDRPVEFTCKTINLSPGDIVYLFTDGIIDQFGGPQSKRFMIKRFKEILLANHNLPLAMQKEKLVAELNQWKADAEQTDDILVLGIKF